MPGPDDGLGKKAEAKIKEWLDRPLEGYCFGRFYDQMNGFYKVSRNISDFYMYKSGQFYYIESKSTWKDNFAFNMLTEDQHDGMLEKSKIDGVHGIVIVLFATHQRAFWLDIQDIKALEDSGTKSLNINKIDKWKIPYKEIVTIPSKKRLHDYAKDGNII